MPHLALVGDSVFDNGRYTAGAPDVVGCLRPLLPSGWTASLNARDGTGITVYGAGLPDEKGERFRPLLGVFDDLIVQAARQLRVIELRAVCVEPSDFVNAIEPSAAGGRKIAAAIAAGVCGSRS